MLCLKVVELVNLSTATEKRECKSCQQVCSYECAPVPNIQCNCYEAMQLIWSSTASYQLHWMLANLFVDQDLQILFLFISWSTLLHINCIGCWLISLLIKTYKSFFFLLAGRLMHQCFLFIPFISTLLSLFMAQAPNIEGCWILSLSSFLVCNTNKWYLLSKNFFNEFMVLRSFLVSTSSDIVLAIPSSASPHLDQYMFLMLNQISIQSS